MFEPTSTSHNFNFGTFSVARKLIINGGAIRPRDLWLKDACGLFDILRN